LLNKLYEVFVCARAAESFSFVNKHEAKCSTCCCFVYYFNSKFETLLFCRGWIVLNLFL